jgi:hypothetical protein
LVVTTTLSQDSYRPGDIISGQIDVSTIDGSDFDSTLSLTFDYSVDFQSSNSDVIAVTGQPLSPTLGTIFQIQIANDT